MINVVEQHLVPNLTRIDYDSVLLFIEVLKYGNMKLG